MKMPILMSALVLLTMLPGCQKVNDWGKDHFYEGEKYFPEIDDPQTPINITKRNMRSLRVYNDFGTLGIFDVLLLNNEVRNVYVWLHEQRMGLAPEVAQQLERRQLAEHEDALSFYVIAFAPTSTMPLDEDGEAPWTVLLKTEAGIMRPRYVRPVELSVEYKYVLNTYLSKHKTVYLVKFDWPAGPWELEFRLPDRRACLSWACPVVPPPPVPKVCTKIKPEKCMPGRPPMARASQETVV